MEKELDFLKEITDVPGGSGDEGLVRNILKREINKVTEAKIDGMGNIYGYIGNGPKVLAPGHMDEIGFKVRGIDKDGKLLIGCAGFVFPYGMECQEYSVVLDDGTIIDGVIGRDPEQGKHSKLNEIPDFEDVRVDIGCNSKEEAEKLGIEIGNSVIAKSHFMKLQNNQIVAKAWDNRIGCAISVRVMQDLADKNLKVTFIGGGTVQEEVGTRGAKALGIHEAPSIAFSLDTAPAADEEGSRVGSGPQLFVMDSGTIAHKKLLRFVKDIAKKNNIPYQLCYLRRGGSDACEFQNVSGGIPVLAIGVAVKNIHTPKSIISYDDYVNTIKLVEAVLLALDEKTIEEIKSF